MAFQSLYRKYRPQSFGELVGQDAVSGALLNAVREKRVGHAYLFSGPRGTGKTSTARLLAKALNCQESAPGGEPCNKCSSCVEVTAGTSIDVLELDAASNNGVAEMRALLERVAYRSAGGARKVYIVDEVHMLSKGASAALLKTLEEPPDHVVFVLATTDPQMVLPTIKSRTQHFEFSLLGTDRLAVHLADIAAREGVEADSETFDLLARRAAGSARDALSLLDQALAYGDGALEADQVRALFGGTAAASRSGVLEAVAAGDVGLLLARLDTLLSAGLDARQLADDLLRHLRDMFLAISTQKVRIDVPDEERIALAALGQSMGAPAVVRALESLGAAVLEIRRAPDPRLILEVSLIRLARRDVTSIEALADRMVHLERAVEQLRTGGGVPAPAPVTQEAGPPAAARPQPPAAPAVPVPQAAPAARGGPAVTGARAAIGALKKAAPAGHGSAVEAPTPVVAQPDAAPAERPPSPTAVPSAPPATAGPAPDLTAVVEAWPRAVETFKPRLKAMAREAQPMMVDEGTIVLGVPSRYQKVHLPTIQAESATVAEALGRALGRPVRIRVVLDDEARGTPEPDAETAYEPAEDFHPEPQPPNQPPRVDSPVHLAIEAFEATVESETVRE